MEVALHETDARYLANFVSRYRKELDSFKSVLIWITALVLITAMPVTFTRAGQHALIEVWHRFAFNQINRALAGEAADMPLISSPLMSQSVQWDYSELFKEAIKSGKEAKAQRAEIEQTVLEVERILAGLKSANFAQLRHDAATLRRLKKTTDDWSFSSSALLGGISIDIYLESIESHWRKAWPNNNLDFSLELPTTKPSTEIAQKAAALECLFNETRFWLSTASQEERAKQKLDAYSWGHLIDFSTMDRQLDPKNLQASRMRILNASSELLLWTRICSHLNEDWGADEPQLVIDTQPPAGTLYAF